MIFLFQNFANLKISPCSLEDTRHSFYQSGVSLEIILLDRVFSKNPLFLSLNYIERSEAAISLKNKLKNHPQSYSCCLDDNIYHFYEWVMMKIVILVRSYFSQYPPLFWSCSFKYFWYNMKQKCILKSLLNFGVLCPNFGHFLYLSKGTYLKLIAGDALCDPVKVFEVFVDTDNNLSMLKDAYLALVAQQSWNVYFLLYHTVVYHGLFVPYSSFIFEYLFKGKR